MKNRPWLETVHAELARQGLPKRHVARLMEELADHTLDLMEEKTMDGNERSVENVEQRLGCPKELAEAAAANYREARFVGRHPWLMFLIAPIPIMVLGSIIFLLVGFGLAEGLPYVLGDTYQVEGKTLDQWPTLLVYLVHGFDFSLKFVVSGIVAILFCVLALRSGRSIRWALTACVLVGLFASGITTAFEWPKAAGETGRYSVGFGMGLSPHVPELTYFVQFLIPLMVGVVFALVYYYRRGRRLEIG